MILDLLDKAVRIRRRGLSTLIGHPDRVRVYADRETAYWDVCIFPERGCSVLIFCDGFEVIVDGGLMVLNVYVR